MVGMHEDVITFLDAVEILSPTSFRVLGHPREIGTGDGNGAAADTTLISALAEELYNRVYIQPSEPGGPRWVGWLDHRDFLASLCAGNTSGGTWEPGWTVRREDNQRLVVGARALEYWVARSDVRTRNGEIAPGTSCSVRVPKEFRYLLKGYYLALGDGAQDGPESDHIGENELQLRYYWHLTREAAPSFVAIASSVLNSLQVPFRLKVVRHPGAYTRADAGVIYVGRRHAVTLGHELGDAISRIHQVVAAGLRPGVPLLTLRLADGLGFAEHPVGASSFGQHRCRLIAKALCQLNARGASTRETRLDELSIAWAQEGLDPNHPYLGASSSLEAVRGAITIRPARSSPRPQPRSSDPPVTPFGDELSLLDAAASIGQFLCFSAHWDTNKQRCNWVGRSSLESSVKGVITPTTAAIGAELYEGSAGIALFLAELHALRGDVEFRTTALGAISRSLRLAQKKTAGSVSPLSLFTGHLGVAYAASRVGALTGETSLIHEAESLLVGLAVEMDKPHPLDVISGNAGAIPALLVLSRTGAHDAARAMAITLGDQLCQAAIRQGPCWSWDPDIASGPGTGSTPLTGMGHGASGMAVALLELYAETGRDQFLEAARGAFAYEDSLFDPALGNWPDLRALDGLGTAPSNLSYGQAWCHGAPGIALARIRAAFLDRERAESHLGWARAVVATTLRAIDNNLQRPRHDASLCHGLAGLLDIALVAGRFLADPVCIAKAEEVAKILTRRHAQVGDYPSGLVSGAVSPTLMLGLAGTGHAFLRLHAPERLPSLLLCGSSDAASPSWPNSPDAAWK
jgi:hypothetical protein